MRAPIARLRAEVEWRVCDAREFAGRDQGGVDRRVAICIDHELMIEHVARAFALQVEIRMLGEIDDRRFVGGRMKVEREFIAVGERVGDAHRKRARKTFIAVRARVREHDAHLARLLERFGRSTRLCRTPFSPPCSVFGPLFAASLYVRPSSENFAPPMRFA